MKIHVLTGILCTLVCTGSNTIFSKSSQNSTTEVKKHPTTTKELAAIIGIISIGAVIIAACQVYSPEHDSVPLCTFGVLIAGLTYMFAKRYVKKNNIKINVMDGLLASSVDMATGLAFWIDGPKLINLFKG